MTSVAEFRKKVLRNLKGTDGFTEISFIDAINDAHKAISRVMDFDEMFVLDTANGHTTANQSNYHVSNDWGLTRCKDIYSIRYMANSESRKLTYVPVRQVDKVLPYNLLIGTGKPTHYTRRGMEYELIKTPNANANLYIYHSQWPAALANDNDTTPYINLDDVITQLTTEMTQAYISGSGISDWTQRAVTLLSQALGEEREKPDRELKANHFSPTPQGPLGNYWNNPWVRRQPE